LCRAVTSQKGPASFGRGVVGAMDLSEEEQVEAIFAACEAKRRAEAEAAARALEETDAQRRAREGLPGALKARIAKSWAKISQLFNVWDADGDGAVSKKELKKGLEALNVGISRREMDLFFDHFDPDRSGTLNLREVNSALRLGAEIPKEILPGAAGDIEVRKANKVAVRSPSQLVKTKSAKAGLKAGMLASASSVGGDAIDVAAVTQSLRAGLQANFTRVTDLFTGWDESGDGKISLEEFTEALTELGLAAPPVAIESLFASWDADGSGHVELAEITRALRGPSNAAAERPALAMRSTNKVAIRRERSHEGGLHMRDALAGIAIDTSGNSGSVQRQLRQALDKNWARVTDLFESWDDDESGKVSRAEFFKAMRHLGLAAPADALDGLFTSFDLDCSGEVDYGEMQKLLRKPPPAVTPITLTQTQRTLAPPPFKQRLPAIVKQHLPALWDGYADQKGRGALQASSVSGQLPCLPSALSSVPYHDDAPLRAPASMPSLRAPLGGGMPGSSAKGPPSAGRIAVFGVSRTRLSEQERKAYDREWFMSLVMPSLPAIPQAQAA